jgi:hypothetical protein
MAKTMEEGLATIYSQEVSKRQGENFTSGMVSYEQAAFFTKIMLSNDALAVLRFRQIEPCFSKIVPSQILSIVPTIDPPIAYELCQPFTR